jgi:hypothetical protein
VAMKGYSSGLNILKFICCDSQKVPFRYPIGITIKKLFLKIIVTIFTSSKALGQGHSLNN